MKLFKFLIFAAILICFVNCASEKGLKSKKIIKDGINILYGEISIEQLFYDFPEWNNNYNIYDPDTSLLDSLKKKENENLEVDIFLGTWCGDSKREVPRFLKILDQAKLIARENIKLFAVDRKKKLANGLANDNNIQRVATFILKKNSEEIGRIVEYPENNLEQDILNILTGN